MSKIKETITALSSGGFPGAVHINRKEREPMTDERLEMVLKFITKIAVIIAITVLVVNADIISLVASFVFAILFSLIYFGLRN